MTPLEPLNRPRATELVERSGISHAKGHAAGTIRNAATYWLPNLNRVF